MMDNYFDWQSRILANAGDDNDFSLRELLDIIPTDIPKDASEFDEELRNLIIDLYSDKSLAVHFNEGKQKTVEKNDANNIRADGIGIPERTEEWKQDSKALENLADEVNLKTEWSVAKAPALSAFSPAHCDAVAASPGITDDKQSSNAKIKEAKNTPTTAVLDHVDTPKAGAFRNDDSEDINFRDKFSVNGIEHEKDIDLPEGNKNDAADMKVLQHYQLCSNDREKTDTYPNPIVTGDDCKKEKIIVETKEILKSDESKTCLDTFAENSSETYQSSLDDLGDGQTARILTSFTDWFSKISSDSSKDLFNSVTLLEDLPKDAFIRANNRMMATHEDADRVSVANPPSELGDVKELVRSHPLGVITEENEAAMKVSGIIEQDIGGFESSQSSFDLASNTHDSGVGSLALLSQLEDTDEEVNDLTSNFKGTDGDMRLFEASGYWDDSLEGQRDRSKKHFSEHDVDDLSGENDAGDALLTELEEKLKTFEYSSVVKETLELPKVRSELDRQVEALSSDYAMLLKEKMKLKKVIWDLEENLSEEKKLTEIKEEEKCDVEHQKAHIESVVEELETKLRCFEVESNKRDEKLQESVEMLQKVNHSYEELKNKAFSTEHELKTKNEDLERTKIELRSYISASTLANEAKEKCESQLKLISEAFQKLKQNKDWLEFQLKTLSDSRAKMQLQFEETKAERNDKAMALSGLEAENKRLSSKLAELNFSSANEKSEILKAMEKIENEIKEHHLLYTKLQKDNKALSCLLDERNDVIEKDEKKIKELIDVVAAAETNTENLTEEISKREIALETMKKDVEDANSRLKEYDELVMKLETEKAAGVLRSTELEREISNLQGKVQVKDENISMLLSEKEGIEKKLEAANDEKAEFEKAAIALKNDMSKINLIFQVMKKDLASKSSMLQSIDAKKVELIKEMKDLQEYMVEQGQVQNELRDTVREKVEIMKQLSWDKEQLVKEVGEMKSRCVALQKEFEKSMEEKEKLQAESTNLKSKLASEREEYAVAITELKSDRDSLITKNAEKENLVATLKQANEILSDNFERVKKENQFEIANLRAKENKLSIKIKEKQQEWFEKEENYEASILSLVEKLKAESIARQGILTTCSEQMVLINKKEEKQRLLCVKIEEVLKNFHSLKEEKEVVRRELVKLKSSSAKFVSLLVSAVDQLKLQLKESANTNEDLKNITSGLKTELIKSEQREAFLRNQLELERERAKELEKDLESMGTELKGAKRQIIVLKKDKDVCLLKFNQFKKKAEQRFVSEDKEKSELLEQMETIKNENRLLTMQLQERDNVLEKLAVESNAGEIKISKLEESLEKALSSEKNVLSERAKALSAYDELQGMVFSLENQLGIERSQTRVLGDQIGNLKWQFKQAALEAQTRKEEVEVLRSQHETEIRNINSLLNVAKTELTCLRAEVSETRKDKQKCNGQLIESRERLRRQKGDFEKLQTDLRKRNDELLRIKEDMNGCKSAAVREMLEFIVKKAIVHLPNLEVFEEDTKPKPCAALDALRKCMSGLRVEMDTLHSEMSSQLDYLQGSRNKLTKFQDNLGELHSACESLHQKSSSFSKSELAENPTSFQ